MILMTINNNFDQLMANRHSDLKNKQFSINAKKKNLKMTHHQFVLRKSCLLLII